MYSNGPLYRPARGVSRSVISEKKFILNLSYVGIKVYAKILNQYLTNNIHFYQYGNLIIFEFCPRIHLQRNYFHVTLNQQELQIQALLLV